MSNRTALLRGVAAGVTALGLLVPSALHSPGAEAQILPPTTTDETTTTTRDATTTTSRTTTTAPQTTTAPPTTSERPATSAERTSTTARAAEGDDQGAGGPTTTTADGPATLPAPETQPPAPGATTAGTTDISAVELDATVSPVFPLLSILGFAAALVIVVTQWFLTRRPGRPTL